MKKDDRKLMKLSVENVQNVVRDCLFNEDEVKDGSPICDFEVGLGVVHNFCFHAGRLAQHNDDILDMINQLPDIENKTSFLSLCMTSEGVQWGEHKDIEQLVALGIASGNLEYCYPREMWPMLPGSLPVVVKTVKSKNKEM
ncbi:MAG: hypothetical protein HFE81_05980 [Bacilli bacterium]|nr:hypothetical protein [Bacilli bacterium]